MTYFSFTYMDHDTISVLLDLIKRVAPASSKLIYSLKMASF